MNVSVLILTNNEAINMPRCLGSLVGIDDILVVDSGSTDDTCKIAKAAGARVLHRPLDNHASQRNFGLVEGGMKHEWVLHMDADEELTPEFLAALNALTPPDNVDGYMVPSKIILNGKWLRYAGMYPTYQTRLGHRDRLRFKQVGHGHREDVEPNRLLTFHEPYLHYNFSHGLDKWFVKHIRYAEEESRHMRSEVKFQKYAPALFSSDPTERRRALKGAVNRLPSWLRPPLRFFHVLILRLGFLDGREGLQYALMLSAYEAMIASYDLDKSKDDG